MIWIPCELSSKFTNLIHQLWRIEQSGLCHFIVLIYDDLIVIVMWVCSAVVIQAWYCKLACSVSWLTQLSLSSSSLGMPHHQWNIRAEAVLWLLLWSLVYFLLHALPPLPFWCFIFFFSLHLLVLKKMKQNMTWISAVVGTRPNFGDLNHDRDSLRNQYHSSQHTESLLVSVVTWMFISTKNCVCNNLIINR